MGQLLIETIAIHNLAIVKNLTFDLSRGLNVFTGETGTGKSLVVDAISFLLGGRSQGEWIGSGGEELKVEASLSLEDSPQRDELKEVGFEEPFLYISRTLNREGRSRARINGKGVPVSFLRDTLAGLVHLHGQQEHEALASPQYQLDALDQFAGVEALELRIKAEGFLSEGRRLERERVLAEEQQRERERQLDFLRYEIMEIENAHFAGEREEEELQKKREFLRTQLKVQQHLQRISDLLEEGLPRMEKEAKGLAEFSLLHEKLAELSSRLANVGVELKDLQWELRSFLPTLEAEPNQLDSIEERLDSISRLKRKYGSTIPLILSYLSTAKEKLEFLGRIEHELSDLEDQLAKNCEQLTGSLSRLRVLRRKKAGELEAKVVRGLQELGIAQPSFSILYHELPQDSLRSYGLDRVEYLFSTNPGEELKPIGKVASGGELSRFMLVLKTALASIVKASTVVFDEVDAGIGGIVGESLARKLRQLSCSHQVLCITHLPQIAAQAGAHFVVEKKTVRDRTSVKLRRVSGQERVLEMARMLAGKKVTSAVLAHARELAEGGK